MARRTNFGQPPHDDGQEETEYARDRWWQDTGNKSKGARRSIGPRLQERDICLDLLVGLVSYC